MATGWGAYFASYVKKKEEPPTVESGADEVAPTKPMSVLQRSSTGKKLYSSPAVPTANVQHTRSNSNAARVANMFGYAAAAKAKMDLEEAQKAKEEPKTAEEVKYLSGLGSLAAQLESLDDTFDVAEVQNSNPPMATVERTVPPVFSFPKKPVSIDGAQDAMSSRMPAKSVPAPQERRRVAKKAKSSISELDALMNMLQMDLGVNTDTSSFRQNSSRHKSQPIVPGKLTTTFTASMVVQKSDMTTATSSMQAKPWITNSSVDESMFFASPIEAPIKSPSFNSSFTETSIKASFQPPTETSIEEIPIMLQTNFPPPEEADAARYFTLSSSAGADFETEEERYSGPTILEYQQISEQVRKEQEQMEMERMQMLEEEKKFAAEEKRLAEEDEIMREFVAEVEREEARIREDEERQERERKQQILDYESNYGDENTESDERDSFDTLAEAQDRNAYQNSEVRIYEEEVEAERLKYEEEEDEARLEVQRLKDEQLAKQQRQAKQEQAEYEEKARLEEERIKEKRLAWRKRREEKERERERREAEEARLGAERLEEERMIQEEEERIEAERLEQEMITFEKQRAEEERLERLRVEEEYRLEARRMEKQRIAERARLEEREREEFRIEEEDRQRVQQLKLEREARWWAERREAEQERLNEQRRLDEERAERQRYEEEQAAWEAEGIRQRQNRIAEQRRMEQERAEQLAEESDDDPLDKDAQMRKAEEKIRAAFGRLAQERGQGGLALAAPILPPKANLGLDVTRAEKGVSRNNTIGMRPQPPLKSPGVLRVNTVAGRPGLPSGPRGGGLPSGPRAGLPAGPRPRRI